ncbi:MAG: hypothetical protein FVQ84_08300 [Planctomycetes bacterium]|nr:hypothetical protein [Planctomycetota bacterium]
MSVFQEQLEGMKDNWTDRNVDSSIDEGVYSFQLQSCKFQEAKTDGHLMIKRVHQVIDGEFHGEPVTDFLHLIPEKRITMKFVGIWVEFMGFECPEDPVELEEIVNQINELAPTYTAEVKKTGDFYNVTEKELLEAANDQEIVAPERGGKPDESIPKKPAKKLGGSVKGIEVGTRVQFVEDGKKVDAIITELKGKNFIVETDAEEPYELELSDFIIIEGGTATTTKKSKTKKSAKTEKEPKAEEDSLAELFAFCQSQEIDCDDTDDMDSLAQKINEYNWEESEMESHELEILKKVGATINRS